MNFYGLVYAFGFLMFYYYLQKSKLKYKDLYFYLVILFSIIFARIYHVVSDFYIYKDNLIKIFQIWKGGLAFYGGVIGFVIANLIYFSILKIKNLNLKAELKNLKEFLDFFAIFLPILIFFGRIANYLNHENNGVFFIPQQFFEALLQGLVPFFVLLFIKKDRFFWFVVLYSIARFITEFWRFYFGIKITHFFIVSILILDLIVWFFYYKFIETKTFKK